jgi:HEAT repeat protein
VPALAAGLTDSQPTVRRYAAVTLGQVGEAAEPAVRRLVLLLADHDPEVREATTEALHKIGPVAIPWLRKALGLHDLLHMTTWLKWKEEASGWEGRLREVDIERYPQKSLRNLGWYIGDALEAHGLVNDLHVAVIKLLGAAGAAALPAVEDILVALGDPNADARLAAIKALAHLGPRAKLAIRALVAKLVAGEEPVRKESKDALAKIDPDWRQSSEVHTFVQSLLKRLEGGMEAAQVTIEALVVIGSSALPALISALESPDRLVRERVATTLGTIGPAARPAVPALRKAMQDDGNLMVREAAAKALERIDRGNPPADDE